MRLDPRGDRIRESVAVNSQRAPRRDLVGIAAGHDQGICQPHFGMQQADRIAFGIVGAEGIGADEFRKGVGLVRVSAAHAAHFVEDHRHAGIRRLPRRFRSGEPAADDMNGFCAHGVRIILTQAKCKFAMRDRRPPDTMKDLKRFHSLWVRAVGSGDADTVWQALDACYGEPARAYHNWTHIEAMLAGLDSVRGEAEFQAVRYDEIELAIYFHDAIYDPHAKDNEARSAEMFRQAVARGSIIGPEAIERIAEMILATMTHGPSADSSTKLLLDLDLQILGSPPQSYDAYAHAVRAEYGFVPEELWRSGRAAVMKRFLERPAIFQTAHFNRLYEGAARENIAREVAGLRTDA